MSENKKNSKEDKLDIYNINDILEADLYQHYFPKKKSDQNMSMSMGE